MIRLQLLSGVRPGELCALTPEAVERAGPLCRYEVREANKNLHRDKPRVVWFGPRAQALLAPFLGRAEPGRPMFSFPPRRPGGRWVPIGRLRYNRLVVAACKRAGVPPWTPHQLRHTYATAVFERYESDAAVGIAIGDSPEVAREVCVDPDDSVRRRIARELG